MLSAVKSLGDYVCRKEKLSAESMFIESSKIEDVKNVPELMSAEGRIRDSYYGAWNEVLREGFELDKRVYKPPDNMVNCLISFGNSLLYGNVLTEIYRTQLNPTISYLHEPGERRFSLSLDLSEVFKPIIVDRTIFNLINNRIIKPSDFLKEMNLCYLNDDGRRTFVREYEGKLRTTVMHKTLKRSVSYGRLIRLECYKLIKHLLGEASYSGFRVWW